MKVREYRSYVSGQEEVLADQSGLPCSCKSALFNKEIVISLEADSVAYISDIAKRFLKPLAEISRPTTQKLSKIKACMFSRKP